MPAKAGMCRIAGCGEERRKGSALCRDHYNQRQREKQQAERDWFRNGLIAMPSAPVATRTCIVCRLERPNDWLYFNIMRDEPHESRYFCICRFCDGSALISGLTIEVLRQSVERRYENKGRRGRYTKYNPLDLRPFRLALDIADAIIRKKRGRVPERLSWDDAFEIYLHDYLESKKEKS